MRYFSLLLALAVTARAETYRLTLKQAIGRALAQNPEVMMARIDQTKAIAGVRLATSPFIPKVGLGSGLAYSNGFPLSIEGSAPAAFEAKATEVRCSLRRGSVEDQTVPANHAPSMHLFIQRLFRTPRSWRRSRLQPQPRPVAR